MESQIQDIQSSALQLSQGAIVKVSKSITKPILITVFGILFFLMGTGVILSLAPTISATLMAGGVAIIIIGLIQVFSAKSKEEYIYTPNKARLKKKSIYFETKEATNIIHAIENKQVEAITKLSTADSSGLMLQLFGNKDADICIVQILKYVPHYFEPACEAQIFFKEDAHKLWALA
ncbi:MAG: hypothetical protein RRX93_06590 [Bacteroidales bacterium]